MMKRFTQALRLLLGWPIYSLSIDGGTMLLHDPHRSEFDYAVMPPFDLAFPGVVENSPPERIFRDGRLRVCLFPSLEDRCEDCGRRTRWLTLELDDGDGKWFHLVTMHESNIARVACAFEDVMAYLGDAQ